MCFRVPHHLASFGSILATYWRTELTAAAVCQVAEGVRNLREGDWVIPMQTHMGTWRSLAVWKESDVLKFPKEGLPLEYAAVCREMCLAYRLLEDANLKARLLLTAPFPCMAVLLDSVCPLLHGFANAQMSA